MNKSVIFLTVVLFAAALAWGQSITVTAPNGCESWTLGTSQGITWSSQGCTGNVRINLVNAGGGVFGTIAIVPVASGSYSWTVGQTNSGPAPSGDYRIGLYVPTQDVDDQSDVAFSIIGSPQPTPSVTVTAPNGGEAWLRGATKTIAWSHSQASGNVRIDLVNAGGGVFGTIATVPVASGSYSWTVGETNAGTAPYGDYRIGLHVADQNVEDLSDGVFKITMEFASATMQAQMMILPSFPDLKVSILPNPASPAVNEKTVVEFRVENIGKAASEATMMRIFMGSHLKGTWNVPGLQPGKHYSLDYKLTPDAPGWILWSGDVDHDSKIKDKQRENNFAQFKMVVRGPDLKITSVSSPDRRQILLQKCVLNVEVTNMGSAACGTFELDVDLDTCPGIAHGRDYRVQEGGLAPGQTAKFRFTHRYKCYGNKSIDIYVDKANQIKEEDESNNQAGFSFNISGGNIID